MTHRKPILLVIMVVLAAVHGAHAGSGRGGGWGNVSKTSIQLDPLRIIKKFTETYKTTKAEDGPTVVFAVDVSSRMNYDALGTWYDLLPWESNKGRDLNPAPSSKFYRRKYAKLVRPSSTDAYTADSISIVDDTSAAYSSFYSASRLGLARTALARVVKENQYVVQFGLVRSRYGSDATLPGASGNQGPVTLTGSQSSLDGDNNNQTWNATLIRPTTANVTASASGAEVVIKADSSTPNTNMLATFAKDPDTAGALLPAGRDEGTFVDAPVTQLLQDARAEVVRIMTNDVDALRPCRNAAVVLVTGGKNGGSTDPIPTARTFLAVTAKGVTKRVPIYVIAIDPPAADVAELQNIAAESGGMYFETSTAGDIMYAASYAVQSVYRDAADFDSDRMTELQTVSPIVGTVDLSNAKDINGSALPNTVVNAPSGAVLPQRANVLLTGGFTLPGFDGRLRAFRAYVPEADSTQANGYRFVKDGTPLWVAHTPAPARRNIYTQIPGIGSVAFTTTNAALLRQYLRQATDADAADLIDFIRDQPLGALLDSTPAVMDPPSLLPPPDASYATFAAQRENRRSMVFVGGNNGMLHAIDGRLGVEAWAFIPFNLLPKLMTLWDGQSVGNFDSFVDSSPKIADVKVSGVWRTYLFVGQGPGGTFYQAFDVSDVGTTVAPQMDDENAVVQAFASPGAVPFKWSFPSYASFDHTLSTTDMPFGDLKSTATTLEKSVGQTWSDPAVGQVENDTGAYVLVTGSGYLTLAAEQQSNRGNVRAGSTLYIIDAGTGSVLASKDVGDDPTRTTLKNSLQGDATAVGPPDTRYITKAYIGDTEGRLWRFTFTRSGTGVTLQSTTEIFDTLKEHPIFNALAVLTVGTNQYIYFMSGSDLMPSTFKLDKFQLFGLLDSGGARASLLFQIPLDHADSKKGDERPTTAPAIAGDVVFFTTTTEWPDNPCLEPETSLYATTYAGSAAYDTNGDGKLSKASGDSILVKTVAGRASSPFIADRHLYFGAGTTVEVFGDPVDFNNGLGEIGVRLLSWRQVK